MGVEKEGSRGGGGYVGGFFQLFDWKAKSRKKLFSSKSDLPERSKQGKRNDGNLPMTRLSLVEEEETGVGSIKGGSDYSCASSVTDDDGYGARAPSVVARLMGLDSLPVSSNYSEPYSTPFSDAHSLQEARLSKKNIGYHHDHEYMYSGYLLHKVEGPPVRNLVEPKPPRTPSKPIEKFQTETLPPKSAKSIPITHHKLLSPIKSPAFIPSKNAAHIMEAAARIIEPGPPMLPPKSKMSHVGSSLAPLKLRELKEKVENAQRMPLGGSTSSVPLKVRDMKDKAEASGRTSRPAEASKRQAESDAMKSLKGHSLNKSWNGPLEPTSFKSCNAEDGSGIKNKSKSISLAIQAKVNVQKREGLSSSTNQSFADQKGWREYSSNQPFKSQQSIQKNTHKKPSPTHHASGVLRQNNQKQNSMPGKDRTSSKSSISSLHSRKALSSDLSSGRNKTVSRAAGNSKTGSRKFGVDMTDSEKAMSYSDTKNSPRKKRLINGGFRLDKNQAIDNVFAENKQKAVQPKPNFRWSEDSNKSNGSDVISFTFTTPLTRTTPCSETSSQVELKDNANPFMDNRGKRSLVGTDSLKLPSLGHNVIGGDALSLLLEQKLKELSYAVENSRQDSAKIGLTSSFESASPTLTPAFSPACTASRYDKKDQYMPLKEKLDGFGDSEFACTGASPFRWKHNIQGINEMDDCSTSLVHAQKLYHRQPSPVSILEHTFSTESCNSSDTTDGSSIDGSKQCSSVQAQEVIGLSSTKKFLSLEADIDLSDSASSTSTATVVKKEPNTTITRKLNKSRNWEAEYVKQMLCNVELMFKNFVLGQAHEIINPRLFDQLENQKAGLGADQNEPRLTRKLLFDCVSECLDFRCQRYADGGCRTWGKGEAMVRQKEWLAEDVYREISGWKGMGDCMVDELVDKDMSSQYGRWLDFEVDAFAVGGEIEGHIFDSLVEEVMFDFLKV